jgi:hypothetical protein
MLKQFDFLSLTGCISPVSVAAGWPLPMGRVDHPVPLLSYRPKSVQPKKEESS